ncbi:MAG: hypothetical protein ACLFVU_02185 [Phycisphaerae bacterium]
MEGIVTGKIPNTINGAMISDVDNDGYNEVLIRSQDKTWYVYSVCRQK